MNLTEQPTYRVIARQMLYLEEDAELPKILEQRLEQIDSYCYAVDYGRLRSRQVIAMVIEQFKRENPDG